MRIYLFRHAEKENAATSNPPLSARGFRQANQLITLVKDQTLSRPQMLLCSPKTRAQQTFSPLAQELKIRLQDVADLDERKNFESRDQFFNRVRNQLSWMEKQNGCAYLVTHLDWIEEALEIIPSDVDLSDEKYHAWAPAQSMAFDVIDGHWHFTHFRSIPL